MIKFKHEEIMHTCHDNGSQCLPSTLLLPILENIFLHKTLLDKHRFKILTHKPLRCEFVNWNLHLLFFINKLIFFNTGTARKVGLFSLMWTWIEQECFRAPIMRYNIIYKLIVNKNAFCLITKVLNVMICSSASCAIRFKTYI